MTNDKKNPLAKRSAEQIKNFLSKKNAYVFYTLGVQLLEHHYDTIQIPKIPSQSGRLSMFGNQMKMPKKQKERSWNAQKEGKTPIALKDSPRSSKELHPHRVKLCKLKEHYLASKKLKTISAQKKSTHPMKGRLIDSLAKEEEGFVKDQRMEYWEEFIQNREERHFNIGRIIKYLST